MFLQERIQGRLFFCSDLRQGLDADFIVASQFIPPNNHVTLNHALASCVMQLTKQCMNAKLQEVYDDEDPDGEKILSVADPRMHGIAFGQDLDSRGGSSISFSEYPVFMLVGIMRLNESNSDVNAKQYQDGQEGGYTIMVCAVFKSVVMVASGPHRILDSTDIPSPIVMREILHPLRIDTRRCPMFWKNNAGIPQTEEEKKAESKIASAAFDKGSGKLPGFKMKMTNVTGDFYPCIHLKDQWIPFGNQEAGPDPENKFHVIPNRTELLKSSGKLPSYRLLLVRDLLDKQRGPLSAIFNSHVGRYVFDLY